MWIHELPTGAVGDSDKFAFDTGNNTYSITFESIVTGIIERAYNTITTTSKTLIGAINELKTIVDILNDKGYKRVTVTDYGFSYVEFHKIGRLVMVQIQGVPYGLTKDTEVNLVAIPQGYEPSPTGKCIGTGFSTNDMCAFLILIENGYIKIRPKKDFTITAGQVSTLYFYFRD
jgi:hypothetical protein